MTLWRKQGYCHPPSIARTLDLCLHGEPRWRPRQVHPTRSKNAYILSPPASALQPATEKKEQKGAHALFPRQECMSTDSFLDYQPSATALTLLSSHNRFPQQRVPCQLSGKRGAVHARNSTECRHQIQGAVLSKRGEDSDTRRALWAAAIGKGSLLEPGWLGGGTVKTTEIQVQTYSDHPSSISC